MVLLWSTGLQGCDASVMIASGSNDAEKDAPDNLSLAGDGFDTVVRAKAAVEKACPGVVSCADVLALAARDVVTMVRNQMRSVSSSIGMFCSSLS